MADDDKRREPFEDYSDSFSVTITPFGANLSFALREAHPSTGKPPKIDHLGTIRMSVEHLKTMVILIQRQVLEIEDQTRIKAEVPGEILEQLHITPEDWKAFWTKPPVGIG